MEDKNIDQGLKLIDQLSKGSQFVLYAYRKISKISYAIYVITDIINDHEPIKWQLRKVSVDTMSFKNFLDEKSVFNTLDNCLLELEGSLELAKTVHIISNMNASLIQSEIRSLLSELRGQSRIGIYSVEISGGFFDVAKPTTLSLEELLSRGGQTNGYKGHKGQDVRYAPQQVRGHNDERGSYQQMQSKGQRKEEIIGVIKQKGTVTIKDVTEAIKDCSEKTIQRELLSMVADGRIKRTGERRWSKYSLI